MADAGYRGIFVITNTTFDDDGALLWDDLENTIDWIIRAGCHGVVWPVMASEFSVLSFPERVEGMRRAVEVTAGRVPVVAGVADTSQAGAVALTEAAVQAGVDAVLAMPPWSTKLSSHALIEAYYRAIAEAGGLPVFIQNVGPPLGSSLPGSFVVELCERIPLVQYLKEEKDPKGQALSEVLAPNSPAVKGVFSGSNCAYLIADHARGVAGSMPAAHLVDVDVQIWELLEAGDLEAARRMHKDKMVLESTVSSLRGGWLSSKEVLRRRGVISSAAIRNQGPLVLDEVDDAQLEYALDLVSQYFRL
jgi:4-hydroxy-tetrahydrodipicolinate synthase